MYNLLKLAALCGLACGPALAHADTVNTFFLTATDTLGGQLSGTFAIDLTDLNQNAFNIAYTRYGYTTSWVDTGIGYGYSETAGQTALNLQDFNAAGIALSLNLPASTFAAYTGGLCTEVTICGPLTQPLYSFETFPPYAEAYLLYSGTAVEISSVTPTPEPSSFLLLGTGLLGSFGMMRKRFA